MYAIGQVLWFRFRYNNAGDVAETEHPYLIIDIDETNKLCEIAQLDSAEGKMHKVLMKTNKLLQCKNPMETAVSRDGFVQLDNTYRVELKDELEQFRRTEATITKIRLESIIKAYRKYHEEYVIDENKNVYLTFDELLSLNSLS